MTKKVMSLLIIACVAMSMIGVTIGVVAYRNNKSETPTISALEQSTKIEQAGSKKYSVVFDGLTPKHKESYTISAADGLDVSLKFGEVKGKLAEVIHVTIKCGANGKVEEIGLLKDARGKTIDLGKNAGDITITFEWFDNDGEDNAYMGATADFVLKITSKTVEEVK